jgi:hypothetical protein
MLQFLPLVAPLVDKLINLIPDPNARAKAAQEATTEILKLAQTSDNAQAQTNIQEAQSESLFKSGWRPYIGWVCGFALSIQYLIVPLVLFVSHVVGYPIPKPPILDDMLWELMFGLLGLGTLRTVEKLKRAN